MHGTGKFKLEFTGPAELSISKGHISTTIDTLHVEFSLTPQYLDMILLSLDIITTEFSEPVKGDPCPLNAYELYRIISKLTPPVLHKEVFSHPKIKPLVKSKPF